MYEVMEPVVRRHWEAEGAGRGVQGSMPGAVSDSVPRATPTATGETITTAPTTGAKASERSAQEKLIPRNFMG